MIAVTLQWLLWIVVPAVFEQAVLLSIAGTVVCGLVVLVWWLFFSRALWLERIGAIALMVAAVFATRFIVHPSIATGMMGMLLPIYAVPVLCLALVLWAAASRDLATGPRRVSMVVSILIACGVFTMLRTGGITGEADSDLHWRWTPSPEERLLAESDPSPQPQSTATNKVLPAEAVEPPEGTKRTENIAPAPRDVRADPPPAAAKAQWPGFRGPHRDGVIPGIRIDTDWSQSAPVELWRRAVGPGWSSFAVDGSYIYTQEQRGEDEIVSSYDLNTGAPRWMHRDQTRFWESNAGAGPRGTPTVGNGQIYTFGATGILNALDARTGSRIWSRNAASDTGKKIPDWGFASSPLVIGDSVVVATGGVLAAYDRLTGQPRWIGPREGWGYSSPHWSVIDGVPQIVLLNGPGAIGVAPGDGTILWNHAWPGDAIVQPAVIGAGDVLIGSGSGLATAVGVRRIAIAHGSNGWSVTERWTSSGLKPYFNDFVVHGGHAFGFDGSILACIDLADGTRKWKGGRYGHGQVLLLADQDLLLVLSEDGELALVSATADQFKELARVPAIEGKTWNHPVLAGDILLVRNGQEMAAFRLKLAAR